MRTSSLCNKLALVLSTSLFSQVALSHAGHDHSAPDASLIHLLWLAPVAIAAGLAYYRLTTKRNAAATKSQDQK